MSDDAPSRAWRPARRALSLRTAIVGSVCALASFTAITTSPADALGQPPPAHDAATYSERDFLTRIRKVTVEGARAGEGYFTPDGRRMVFQSEREADNPFYQIYTLDLTTGESQRVSPGHGKTTCAFFRPGTLDILFAMILVARILYLGVEIYANQGKGIPAPKLTDDMLTMLAVGLTAGYFARYSAGLLLWRRKMRKAIDID